jgi:hypothetical protein
MCPSVWSASCSLVPQKPVFPFSCLSLYSSWNLMKAEAFILSSS